jgi:soluble lytic murein transglycosylase-like protein
MTRISFPEPSGSLNSVPALFSILVLLVLVIVPATTAPSMAVVQPDVMAAAMSRLPAIAEPALVAPEAPARASEAAARRDEPIDALAGFVSRRYRVAEPVIRDLLGAAFREGRRNGLDPLLIVAVMAVESRFNPIAQSETGAVGLMQIVPRFHVDKFDASRGESPLDPATNIHVGTRVLKEYIRRAGSQVNGLQLYNGTPDDENASYATKVLEERQRLQQAVARRRLTG